MKEEIKKKITSGVGAVFLTRERLEKTIRKMVEEAKISKADARRLSKELAETGEREWADMERRLKEVIRKGRDGLDIGSRKEIETLKIRIEDLEKRVRILEEVKTIPGRDPGPWTDL